MIKTTSISSDCANKHNNTTIVEQIIEFLRINLSSEQTIIVDNMTNLCCDNNIHPILNIENKQFQELLL